MAKDLKVFLGWAALQNDCLRSKNCTFAKVLVRYDHKLNVFLLNVATTCKIH